MKRYDKAELETMKPAFITWLPTYYDGTDQEPDDFYGADEYDELEAVTVDDDNTVTCWLASRDRQIVRPAADQIYIREGDLEWSGDDVDYFGSILEYFAMLHNIT